MTEQDGYQVRFDWGFDGIRAAAATVDVLVWVDELAPAGDVPVFAVPGAIVTTGLRTAAATAAWILQLQAELRRRLAIGVIAAGSERADGSRRCDVEDLLAAGAVIDRLAQLGIDASSPEAAAAEAAHRVLGRAVGHLVSASVGGRAAATSASAHGQEPALGLADVRVVREHPDRLSLPTG